MVDPLPGVYIASRFLDIPGIIEESVSGIGIFVKDDP